MPTRTARTAWTGSLQEGSGQVELSSSHVGTYDVSFPKRAADDADGTTSPEELIAAAHSSCFAMQLSANIAEAGGQAQRFLSVYNAYAVAKDVTIKRLYIETMQDILTKTPSIVVDGRLQGIVPYLPLDPTGRPRAPAVAPASPAPPSEIRR